jgi:hypothetical protein
MFKTADGTDLDDYLDWLFGDKDEDDVDKRCDNEDIGTDIFSP